MKEFDPATGGRIWVAAGAKVNQPIQFIGNVEGMALHNAADQLLYADARKICRDWVLRLKPDFLVVDGDRVGAISASVDHSRL